MKQKIAEMKKEYISPSTDVTVTRAGTLMTASGVSDPDRDIDYGGVDEEGNKDPASRRYDVWGDDEEEQEGN